MVSFEVFHEQLTKALAHLFDPDYRPSDVLRIVIDHDPKDEPASLQRAIARAIEEMRPPAEVPAGSPARRNFDILYYRYVLKLTQEEVAEQLLLSSRTVQRAQREAIYMLAQMLWETYRRRCGYTPAPSDTTAYNEPFTSVDWRAQLEQELALLHAEGHENMTEIADVIREAAELARLSIQNPQVHVELGYVQPGLTAAIHPVVLCQLLIAAIARLGRLTQSGCIRVSSQLYDGDVRVTVSGPITGEPGEIEATLTHGLPLPAGATVHVQFEGRHVFWRLSLPSSKVVTVLVIDDNPEMVHFYRRCTIGTCYRVVHAPAGRTALETIVEHQPDIVVLDVMLPDVDGWKVLMRLHENPATRGLPVIVCSVIREEELALALGASLYLAKPVTPQEFVRALDQLRPPRPAEDSRAQGLSAPSA